MNRQKAAEIVGYRRQRAKTIGCFFWIIMPVLGIGGWIYWKWYAFPIVLVAGYIFGSIYSLIEVKRTEKLTGLNIHEQEIACSESLIAAKHPLTRDPTKYKEYIDSLDD
jgi:hypothetical protein